ncbi:Carbamoyltransferase HypF [Paraburkholderia sacchari]|uniref:carbamoyltransferase HypF n=1 Tax=Paraburkholderia sacchari TaxID=159450 RepID=UPI0039A509AC
MMRPVLRAAGVGGSRQRLRIEATGAIQGVGFRPFVYRLAASEGLGGFVRNTGDGVVLEVEGPVQALTRFVERFDTETVAPMSVRARSVEEIDPQGADTFEIAPSTCEVERLAVVLPDLAVCAECLAEMSDPGDRRYRYPFTTCMHCGPRFSIVDGTPYDRVRTSMRQFKMCTACQAEYDDPASRRFHAETNACPMCGPTLALWDVAGHERAAGGQALSEAVDALRQGAIVAMKGLGGFQLLADARNELTVQRLRARKGRPSKPFAIMVPTCDDAVALAEIDAVERALLCSAAAPIVLLRSRSDGAKLARAVAPGHNAWLGVMLPYTPLHHLLMRELGFPVVATSGNRSGEPIVASEHEALERLGGLAECFLVHDRPILHPVDDPVVRVIAGEPVVLRHARGYAPLDLALNGRETPDTACVALGAHGKSAVALASKGSVVLGPYIGDLDGSEARAAFARSIATMKALYGVTPGVVACDAHPDYYSTQYAQRQASEPRRVPHHLAHVLSGMVEHGLEGPLLGVAWDGTGYGDDGSVWGGEFLAIDAGRCRRVAHLLPFRLPGGEAAARQPNRAALGVLHAMHGEAALSMTSLAPVAAFTAHQRGLFVAMLGRGICSPWTSSAGRLFDAAAAILGLCSHSSFEGEAAIALESAATGAARAYPLEAPVLREEGRTLIADWRPAVASLARAIAEQVPAGPLARGFHEALADLIVAVARRVGMHRVLLTGGCFQNALLALGAIERLRTAGFDVRTHHRVPPNDGGLAVGQAAFAMRPLIEEKA